MKKVYPFLRGRKNKGFFTGNVLFCFLDIFRNMNTLKQLFTFSLLLKT